MAKQQAFTVFAKERGGIDVLDIRKTVPHSPGKNQLLVRHTAIGVNFIDIYFRTGVYPWTVEKDLVLGCEAAGIVEKVGADVTGFEEGDRISYTFPNGAYTTHRAVDASIVVKLPDEIDDRTAAAAMLKGLTAHYLINSSYKAQKSDNILFHAAAGGVGLIVGQWLKHKGVNAIGTAGSDEKCATAKAHGYSTVINYKSQDFVEQVMKLTNDEGVAAVYDAVGRDTIDGSLKVLKRFGSLISFGQSSGAVADFRINDLAVNSLYLQRPTLFHYATDRQWLDAASAEMFELIAKGVLKIEINQEYALKDVAQAHSALENRTTTGSTILIP